MNFKALGLLLAVLCSVPVLAKDKGSTPRSSGDITFTKSNILILNLEVDGDSVSKVIKEAKELDSALPSGDPIFLFLDTPGGSIQSGLELIEALRGLNRPIHTVSIFSASMGFQIAQGLGTRYILRNGILMSHKAYGGFFGEFGGEGGSQLDSRYSFWLQRISEMDEQTVKRTGGKQTLKSYRAAYENELWLTGQKAVEQGYADQVVQARCDKTIQDTRESVFYTYDIKVTLVFDSCPLNTYPVDTRVEFPTTEGLMELSKFYAAGGILGQSCYDTLEKDAGAQPYSWSSYSSVVPVATKARRPCPLDRALTHEAIEKAKGQAKSQYSSRKKVVKMYW